MNIKRLLFSIIALLMICAQYSFGQNCVISCPPSLTVCPNASTSPDYTGYAIVTTGSGTGVGGGVYTGSGTNDLACSVYIISSTDYATKNSKCPGALIIQRTWTATNPNDPSQTTSCVQTIFQSDEELPIINSCPTDIEVMSDNENCDAVVTWNHPTATDNCGLAHMYSDYDPGTAFPFGPTVVTYSFVDNCGNIATCSFTVNVTCESGGSGGGVTTYDNCGPDSLSYGNVHFSLNQCQSDSISLTNQDFEEFTSVINIAGDSECMDLSSTILYRNNPQINTHSCTEGVYGTPAMCVGMSKDCFYEVDSDQAVRFEVTLDPLLNSSRIDHLEFYELAPTEWAFLGGDTGPNDYPTRYAVRVLANDVEVFHQFDIPTSTQWSREFFDFSGIPAFEVDTFTRFEFQLTAYCSILGNSGYSVWDLDAISVNASCGEPQPEDLVSGGTLTGGPFDYCVEEFPVYTIPQDSITLSGNTGVYGKWIITDTEGIIIAILSSPYNIDFNIFDNQQSLIYYVSYNPPIVGFNVGNSINSQMLGCYGISNPITVTRFDDNDCPDSFGISIQEEDEEEETNIEIGIGSIKNKEAFDFDLYPNPTENHLSVDISGLVSDQIEIELTDAYGKQIRSLSKKLVDQGSFEMDVTDLTGGIYLIKISNGKKAKFKKFIKVN